MRRSAILVLSVASAMLASGLPVAQSIHEYAPHTEAPVGCEPVALSTLPGHERPLVRARWERAAALAPNTCLLPPTGAWWDCAYAERLPGRSERVCFWPGRDESAFLGDGSRLEMFVDLAMLRKLADAALLQPQVQELVGSSADVEVRVGLAAASFRLAGGRVAEAYLLNPPPACTPVAGATDALAPPDARGVCSSRVPTRAGACRFTRAAPEADAFLCWWGRAGTSPDFVIEVSPDALRAILNAEDTPTIAKWALQQGYLTLWARDLGKRAAIRAALEFGGIGHIPDPLPPLDEPGRVTIQGRLFNVTFFPRDGVLTPCARDGAGTWYWLNEFGAPNGFVGSSTIEAMKRLLAAHGPHPDHDTILADLLINYRPGGVVTTPDGPGTVVYRFAPGSPFALIPLAQTPSGDLFELDGGGSVVRPLTASDLDATNAAMAAASAITSSVDFNRQPGTLAQDLRFLRYAIARNPAAPQIETVLQTLAHGDRPAADDVEGLFPPSAPRLATDAGLPRPALGNAVAAGDSLLLGMASHTLIWHDLLAHGAIQPPKEAAP